MTVLAPLKSFGRFQWAAVLTIAVAGVVALRNAYGVVQFMIHRAVEGDFALYYVFARIGLRHGWSSLYDLAAQRQEWHAFGPTLFYPEIYPPPLGWLVAPFALLPFGIALTVWTIGLVVALLCTWWLCMPARRWTERAAHLAIALALPPVAFGILLGQVVVLVAAAVAIAWWLIPRGRPFSGGLVLALIALKPQLAFLVPLALLASGRRRVFTGWLTGSATILAFAVLTTGADGLLTYGHRLLAASSTLEAFIVPVQLTVSGLLGGGAMAHLAQLCMAAAMVFFCWRRRAEGPEFPIAAGLCASLLVTPFVHAQDLTMLLPAIWLSLRTSLSPVERALALSGYGASLLLATPLPLLLVLIGWAGSRLEIPARFRTAPSTALVRSTRGARLGNGTG